MWLYHVGQNFVHRWLALGWGYQRSENILHHECVTKLYISKHSYNSHLDFKIVCLATLTFITDTSAKHGEGLKVQSDLTNVYKTKKISQSHKTCNKQLEYVFITFVARSVCLILIQATYSGGRWEVWVLDVWAVGGGCVISVQTIDDKDTAGTKSISWLRMLL